MAQQVRIFNRWIPVAEQVERIEAVDAAAVARVARRIFAGPPTVAAIGPLETLASYDEIRKCLAY